MTVDFDVCGINTSLICDTGASVTVLSRDVYNCIPENDRPQLHALETPVKLETVDKDIVNIDGVAKITFETENDVYVWDVFIAPIKDSGLIGLDFLYHHEFQLSGLGLKLNGQIVPTKIEGTLPKVCRVALAETVTVPAGSEVVVNGITGNFTSECGVIEPCPLVSKEHHVEVGCTLVNPQRGDIGLPVRLMNTLPKDIVLHEGLTVGYVHEVDDVSLIAQSEHDPNDEHISLAPLCKVHAHKTGDNDSVTEECELPPHLHDLYERSCKHLQSIDRIKLKQLLVKHSELFAKSGDDLGRTSLVTHKIDTGDARPIKQAPRRPPRAFAGEEEKIVQSQLEAGVIEESTSPWASPLVYVRKKDGSTRPCVDYRRLNEVTAKDAYPLPRVNDCLDCLSGAKYFSTLDLQSGYWQLLVDEKDRPKTAFATKSGLYQYITMPFGLCNAPSTFERCMELVLRGLQWKTLLVYLDDIIVFASSVQDSLCRLDTVFAKLSKAGLKLKPSKCSLMQLEVPFLGFIVTGDGIKTDPTKIECVKSWPVPRNRTDVRSFLGFCSYYRRFVRSFSAVASPLNKLLEAGESFEWTTECDDSFKQLKDALISAEVMAYPSDEGLYVLDTDASLTSIGCCLSQVQWNEERQKHEERPIAYGSKSLTKSQRRYCVTRRELLAVVTFMLEFKHYLLGREVLVRTDHSALRWLLSFKEPEDQMARWLEVLSQFDFRIEHRAGKQHGNADGLSRQGCDPEECTCYDGESVVSELPCHGCDSCVKKHREWSAYFEEVGDIVPLVTKNNDGCGDTKDVRNSANIGRVSAFFSTIGISGDGVLPGNILVKLYLMLCVLFSVVCHKVVECCEHMVCVYHGVIRRLKPAHREEIGDRSNELPVQSGWKSLGEGLSKGAQTDSEEIMDDAVAAAGGGNCKTELNNTSLPRCEWAAGMSTEALSEMQMRDPDLAEVRTWFISGRPDRDKVAAKSPAIRHLWLLWSQLMLVQGVLYKRWFGKDGTVLKQLLVPRELYDSVLRAMHDSIMSGHLGVRKTLRKIQKSMYWYRMKNTVMNWIRKCSKCSARKRPGKMPHASFKSYQVGAPMDRIVTDLLGPFPETKSSNKYILLAMDQFTHWVEAYGIPDQRAETVAHKLVYEFMSRMGIPLDLHSDQGKQYTSDLCEEVCKLLEIHKTRTSAYHPEGNGTSERFNQVLLDMISAYVADNQSDWDEHLPLLTSAYRSCVHDTTGYSPNMLMLGRETHLPIHLTLGGPPCLTEKSGKKPCDYVTELHDRMDKIHALVRERLEKAVQVQDKCHDTRIVQHNYKVGDLVRCHDSTKTVGLSPKLKSKWPGPFIVTRKCSDLLFEIKGGPKTKAKVVHHNRLRPYTSDDVPEWVPQTKQKLLKGVPDSVHKQDKSVKSRNTKTVAVQTEQTVVEVTWKPGHQTVKEETQCRRSQRKKTFVQKYGT